ncbi:hypothetical protein H5S09_09455 [Limosilactobacillus sp. STM2_1]|uniref:Uncharacterized protein n=1 Tax=Limosilactobacillus rudii TaxID=2759755 RepID=A0A7W3YPA3_9LACO|nr:hypothetical protein [Limosilactobacillus rudii]MBB1078730.1 hypothetical protein [Limosilactobacillus rudii]MBB1098162.1 hypothetical protein [Limosilactobacillus rudii]MCD7135234.1 hypothetical protein [Limosilactobacillus rudii]
MSEFDEIFTEKNLKNSDKFVPGEKALFTSKSKEEVKKIFNLDEIPTYAAYEVVDSRSAGYAISLLFDQSSNHGNKKPLTVVAIGANPKGDNENNTARKDMKKCSLEPTRQVELKKTIYTLRDSDMYVDKFVQLDLFADRTNKAYQTMNSQTLSKNKELIKY